MIVWTEPFLTPIQRQREQKLLLSIPEKVQKQPSPKHSALKPPVFICALYLRASSRHNGESLFSYQPPSLIVLYISQPVRKLLF